MHKSQAANVTIAENAEILAVIREEQTSPPISLKLSSKERMAVKEKLATQGKPDTNRLTESTGCLCGLTPQVQSEDKATQEVTEDVEKLLKEREAALREEYDKLLEKEISTTRERFDFILQNEQLRASYMLREAHRERQEKIKALESQLECKNLAALMYVMCTERTRSKLEKNRLIEEYNKYILGLQDLLHEGQELILYLSRGYKTAARVDHEWRTKMMSVVGEFMKFIYNFAGGPEENNQFFLDLPALITTNAPIIDDPKEYPCDCPEEEDEESIVSTSVSVYDSQWWNTLGRDDRPFVVFGDLADFKGPERRKVLQTLKAVKATKTAPRIWNEYVFNDLTLRRSCNNTDEIKDIYPKLRRLSTISEPEDSNDYGHDRNGGVSRLSLSERRATVSMDFRGGAMSSLLRIITSASTHPHDKPTDKAALLGARDSMEITSTTKLKQACMKSESKNVPKEPVTLDIGRKHKFGRLVEKKGEDEDDASCESRSKSDPNESEGDDAPPRLASLHNDSLEVIATHKPDKDHVIGYERYCAAAACQRMQMDEFMRSLPPYMRANPFTHFEQSFDSYETCTPEQFEILRQRMEHKRIDAPEDDVNEDPLKEWELDGVGVQTSIEAILPPCVCSDIPTPVDSNFIFDLKNLEPVKRAIDDIKKKCFFDKKIEFDRFKVIGEDSESVVYREENPEPENFTSARRGEIIQILQKHPSLLDLFQANTRCS